MSSTISTMPGASPKRTTRPSLSAAVSTPSSKHSMANATAAPAPMVSRPKRLHISLALATAARSSTPQPEPNAARVSYSGPP